MMTNSASKIHKLACVIDVRSRSYFDDLAQVLGHLDDLGVRTRVLFLDASDEVLIKRYESVRRPHPLQHGSRLIDGITEERALLANLREHADIVIDTSDLSIHQLSTKLYEGLLGEGATTVAVHIFSSGSSTGCRSTPISWPMSVSCRTRSGCPAWRELTGWTSRSATMCCPATGPSEFLDAYEKALAVAIEGYAKEDKHFVTIAVGCTGASTVRWPMSEALAKRLRARGLQVTVSARELAKRHN